MKKLFSIILLLCICCNTVVFAQSPYTEFVAVAKKNSDVDLSQIDEDNVFIAEVSNHLMLKLGKEPTKFYLAMPTKDSDDLFVTYFENEEYLLTTKNFSAMEPLKYFDNDTAKSYVSENGLSTPNEIKGFIIQERVLMFSYNVVCDNKNYIIPYYFMEDSIFNVTNDEECKLEIGKAYDYDEIIKIFEKEEILYGEYMAKKNEEERAQRDFITKDKDGDVVIHEPNEKDVEAERQETSKSLEKPVEEVPVSDKDAQGEDSKETQKEDLQEPTVPDKGEDTESQNKSFEDVPPTHWAYKEVSALATTNVILGYGNGYFGVNDFVTHEQLSLLLERQFGYTHNSKQAVEATREEIIVALVKALNVDLSGVDNDVISQRFLDGNVALAENESCVAFAVQNELVVGYAGYIRLGDKVTRAETATLIYRAMNLAK